MNESPPSQAETTTTTYDRPLTDDEKALVTHISMWGSTGYPVRKGGRVTGRGRISAFRRRWCSRRSVPRRLLSRRSWKCCTTACAPTPTVAPWRHWADGSGDAVV